MGFFAELFATTSEPVIEGIDQAREIVAERKAKKISRTAKVNDTIALANDKDELLTGLVSVTETFAKEDKVDASKKKLAKALNL